MKAVVNYTLPEVNETKIESKTIDVVSSETGKSMGKLIVIPEINLYQEIKCISKYGDESFLYKVTGKVYFDFDNLEDIIVDGESVTVWIK